MKTYSASCNHWLIFGLALSAFYLLPACAKRETAVEAGIRTKTLLVGNGAELANLDPHILNSLHEQSFVRALFESLTMPDQKTLEPRPAAAERWEVSADGLVYTFYLRPTARWSNGDPVTAKDFVFSFRRALSPKLGSAAAYLLFPLRNAKAFNSGQLTDASAVGAEAIDDRTLRLTLEGPTPYLLALAAHNTWMPVHRATIEKFGRMDVRESKWTRPGNLVGNGPFTLAEWKPNNRIVVRKNPHYWDAAHNRLEQVDFFPTENSEVEERNFRAGQVHVTWTMPPTKIVHYRERAPAKLRSEPLVSTAYLNFNVRHKALSNVRFRRALSLAIDRDAIVAAVFFGAVRPAAHFTPPGCGGYTARARMPTDILGARRLLAEAGFAGGQGLSALEIHFTNNSEWSRLAEILQETWRRELGVRVGLAPAESKTKIQNEQTGNYSISIGAWTADFADPATFMEIHVANGGDNVTGWSDPVYDRLIAEASRTLEFGRRFELFQQAEALLLEQAPVAPVYFQTQNYLIHPAVKNWQRSALYLSRFQDAWLEQ